MKHRVLFYHPEHCSGCRRCELACALQSGEGSDPNEAYIRVLLHPRLGTPSLLKRHDCLECGTCVGICNLEALHYAQEHEWGELIRSGWTPVPVVYDVQVMNDDTDGV